MTVLEKQEEMIDNFAFFDDWNEKYSYLIDIGKKLSSFPDDKKTNDLLIKGCQSQVWFDSYFKNEKLYFTGTSDALIVAGILGLLINIYSDAQACDIVNSSTDFLEKIGLSSHLSATRNSGLHSMLNYIYTTAKNQCD